MLGYKISFLLMVDLIFVISHGFGITVTPCSPALKDSPCNITCTTPDFSKSIDIKCNGFSQGNCGGFGCTANMYQTGTDTTYLEIPSLSYSNHLCEWTCTYGTNTSNALNLTIYSGISGQLNTTGKQNGNNVQLETIVDCLYPSDPSVKVQYSSQKTGPYQTLQEQPQVSLRSSSGTCSNAIENRVTATSTVSGDTNKLQGKTVFFRMMFLQYPSGNFTYSVAVDGPFSFEGCGSDGELFMCGFSFFIIEFAVFIVIMVLLKLKKMGGFTKLKIVVSCVFLLVALIIGIILGVVLMECSKKNLSLGLGIGLGCMLASAHFVTIYVIHKKNDSKKHDKDKERQGTPVSTSNVKVTSETPVSASNVRFTSQKASSHGNPASKNGNVIVSLPNEPIRPLPVPPATRKNQLEPLSVENDGATSPEKKKKKKKKKKRKNTESTDAPEES